MTTTEASERKPKRKGARHAFYVYETEKTDCCDAFYTFSGDGMAMCRWCFQEVWGRFADE